MRLGARAIAVAVTGLLISAGFMLPSGSAQATVPPGQIGIKLLDGPASQQNDARAREYIVDQLGPGGSLTRHVEIVNTTTTLRSISVYAAGASIGGGSFIFADGTSPNELSSWTTVSTSTLSLKPGQSATVAVTIAVPANASSGERYAVIWAQATSAAVPGTIGETNRVGVRIYLDVAGSPQPSSFDVTTFAATRALDGTAMLAVTVHNTGGRAIDLNGTLILSAGPVGAALPPPATVDKVTTIAAGDSQPVHFNLGPKVANGPWKATVVLASGDLTKSASSIVTFPARTGPTVVLAPLPPKHSGSSSPVWLIVTIGLTVLSIALGFFLGRRGHRRRVA